MSKETIHVVIARYFIGSAVIKVEAESAAVAFPIAYDLMSEVPHADWRYEVAHIGSPDLAGGIRQVDITPLGADARDVVMPGVQFMSLQAKLPDASGRILEQKWFNDLPAATRLKLIEEWSAELASLTEQAWADDETLIPVESFD